MHGTCLLSGLSAIAGGGTCVTLVSKSFEAELALQNIEKHRVTTLTIVGDAFARPLVEFLDENPGKYDFSSVIAVTSSGVMWTRDVKAGLLRHNENLLLADGFYSSEAIGLGSSIMTKRPGHRGCAIHSGAELQGLHRRQCRSEAWLWRIWYGGGLRFFA